jgi:hypothetical protein
MLLTVLATNSVSPSVVKGPAASGSTFIGRRDAHSNTLANKYLANFGNADNRAAV